MHTRTENLQDNDVGFPSAGCHSSIRTFGFRTALVIEESENLRRSLVKHLKEEGMDRTRSKTPGTSDPGLAAHTLPSGTVRL